MAGFRSRWMMPRAWASAIARAQLPSPSSPPPRGGLRLAADGSGEAAARHELQREVRQPVMIAVLVDLDDPRVLEPGDGAGLDGNRAIWSLEACAPASTIFSADQAIEADVPGLVHDAHAAAADLLEDLVARHGRPMARRPASWRRPITGPGASLASSVVASSARAR